MIRIKSYDRYFTIIDDNSRIGLKRGDASYKIDGVNLKLYYVDDWFYKHPIKTMDIPIEIDGTVYNISNIDNGLEVIFPTKNGGGSGETITVDDALSTTSENPVQNKVITNAINNKITTGTVYTKSESDNKFQEKGNYVSASTLNNYYTKAETSGKTEIANALNDKASNNDVEEALTAYTYDKSTIDEKIAQGGSFDPTQYYNKTQTDALLEKKANTATTYTKAEVDALIANFVTSAQVQNQLTAYTYDKQTIDDKIASGVTPTPTPVYDGKARLTLNDGSIVTISGTGELTSAETKPYTATTIAAEIGSGCTSIGNEALYGCSRLTSVTIPDTVTSIGNGAILLCDKLTSVTIPDTVTSIGESAFRLCSGLTSVTIGSGVTSIGTIAFNSCTSLTSITIPDSVTTIGERAFQNCSGLTSITCNATTPPTLGQNVFFNAADYPIYVPSQSVEAYKTAEGWSKYASTIKPIS